MDNLELRPAPLGGMLPDDVIDAIEGEAAALKALQKEEAFGKVSHFTLDWFRGRKARLAEIYNQMFRG